MQSIHDLYLESRPALEERVAGCSDVKAAADEIALYLDGLKRDYLKQPEADAALAGALFAAGRSAIYALASATEVDVQMRLPEAAPPPRRVRSWREAVPYLPVLLCAALGLWLYLDSQTNAALLAIVAAGAESWATAKRKLPELAPPAVTGTARVDATELLRRVERLTSDLDTLLLDAPEEEKEAASAPGEWSREMLEAMQMLMEARLSGDGQFALAALPQLVDALNRAGVELVLFSPEVKQHFDLFPALEGDVTIRPALMKDGRLLARGQATTGV